MGCFETWQAIAENRTQQVMGLSATGARARQTHKLVVSSMALPQRERDVCDQQTQVPGVRLVEHPRFGVDERSAQPSGANAYAEQRGKRLVCRVASFDRG